MNDEPLSMAELGPYSPMGSPPTSPRQPSPTGPLDDLSSNPSIEYSSSPIGPTDFKKLMVLSELRHHPCQYNNGHSEHSGYDNEDATCDIPAGTILDIIDVNKYTNMGPIFKCNFTYNGILHSTYITKSMLSEDSPKIEYVTNRVGGYKRRSIKRRSIKRRRRRSRKGRKSRSRSRSKKSRK
jgi:hypothetical protein